MKINEPKRWITNVEIKSSHPILPEFSWNIPSFAVIAGINGSGKTQLLKDIYNTSHSDCESSLVKLTVDEVINFSNVIKFIPHNYDVSNLNPNLQPGGNKQTNEGGSSQTTENRNDQILAYFKQPQKTNPDLDKLAAIIEEKTHSTIDKLTDDGILDNLPPDCVTYLVDGFNNQYIEELFKRYSMQCQRIILKNVESGIIVKENKACDYIGHPPPWKLINRLFDKYGFHYHINEPPRQNRYMARFFDKENNKTQIPFSELSSGEQIIITLILWAYNEKLGGKNKVLLLDEFDAHLNPSLSKMLIDVIKNTLVNKFGIQVIMTTHSPSTVAHVDDEDLFWMERSEPIKDSSKKEIIPILSSGIMTYQEASGLLECVVKSDSKVIIFTEGDIDEIHIKTAKEKLRNKLSFDIFPCDGADKLKQFLIGCPPNLFSDKKIVGVFDYDKEGIEKVISKGNFTEIKEHIYQLKNSDYVFAITLPAPKDLKQYKNCPIEFLYSEQVLNQYGLLKRKTQSELSIFLRKLNINGDVYDEYVNKFNNGSEELWCYSLIEGKKQYFAKEIIPVLEAKEFENFKPLFEIIKWIIKMTNNAK
ncbi:MAG: hypothetical protein AMJ43_05335 [Coxiella sp. DG_40]|nr:MAG: hypothetical protein AMJ43_05335 [Coxiella sp. DG_40]